MREMPRFRCGGVHYIDGTWSDPAGQVCVQGLPGSGRADQPQGQMQSLPGSKGEWSLG